MSPSSPVEAAVLVTVAAVMAAVFTAAVSVRLRHWRTGQVWIGCRTCGRTTPHGLDADGVASCARCGAPRLTGHHHTPGCDR